MKRPFQTGDSIALSVDRHARLHGAILQAERLAALTLTTIRGRTAEAVAVEVAAKVIHTLRAKRQPEAAGREIAR
jgi:hypothetical protein